MHRLITFLFLALVLFYRAFSKEIEFERCYSLLKSDPDSAMILARIIEDLSRGEREHWAEANSLYIQAFLYEKKRDLPNAFLKYIQGIHLLEGKRDERSIKLFLDISINAGSILRKYARYKEAVEMYDRALQLAGTKSQWTSERFQILYNKSSVLQDAKDLAGAISPLEEALLLAKAISNDRRVIKCLNMMGLILKDGGRMEEARNTYLKILTNEKSNRRDSAMAYHNAGVTFLVESKYPSAEIHFRKALELKNQMGDQELIFSTRKDLASALIQQGHIEQGLEHLLPCEDLYPLLSPEPEKFKIFHMLDSLYYIKGNYELSQVYAQQYYREAEKYRIDQNQMIRTRDQYQIELLLVTLNLEVEAREALRNNQLDTIIIKVLLFVILIVIGFFVSRDWYLKRSLESSISRIKRDFDV